MRNIYLIIIAVLIVALVAIFLFPEFFKQIMAGVGGLLSLFMFKKNKIKKQVDEVNQEKGNIKKRQKESKSRVDKINKDREKRKKEADQHSENMKKKDKKFKDTFFSILLIFFLILTPIVVQAEDGQPLKADELVVPDNYDGLLEKYYEMFEWGIGWRQDAYTWKDRYYKEYDNGEQLNLEIDYLNKDLDNALKLIETQQKMIDQLMNGGFGLSAGVNYVPLNPKNTGLMLSVDYEF